MGLKRELIDDLVFRTRWGFDEDVYLTLWRIGDDIIPTFYGVDLETTQKWLDYVCAANIRRSGGIPVRSYSLLNAGEIVPISEVAPQ